MTGTDTASIWAGILQIATVALALILLYRPLGDGMARVFTSTHDARVERGVYRVIGVDAASEQTWPAYTRGVLLFSLAGVVFVYALQRLQAFLPSSLGFPAVPEGLASPATCGRTSRSCARSSRPTRPRRGICSPSRAWAIASWSTEAAPQAAARTASSRRA